MHRPLRRCFTEFRSHPERFQPASASKCCVSKDVCFYFGGGMCSNMFKWIQISNVFNCVECSLRNVSTCRTSPLSSSDRLALTLIREERQQAA